MTKIEILENGNVKLTIPMSFRHCAGRKRIIVPDDSEKLVDPLVLNLARAFRWQELIDSGTYSNAIELARAVGKDTAYVARTIRLTLLAPGNHSRHFAWDFEKEYFNGNIAEKLA